MKLRYPMLAICCVITSLIACKKEKNLSDRGKLLVTGKWNTVSETASLVYNGKDTTMDVPMEDCDKDDFVQFSANGRGSINENTNKCTDDNQVENFSWALLDNDTRLALVDSNPDTFHVDELSTTLLKVKLVKPNASGTPVTYVFTYKNIK